jgi:hypothetical protein
MRRVVGLTWKAMDGLIFKDNVDPSNSTTDDTDPEEPSDDNSTSI